MPRPAKVSVTDAVDAICLFGEIIENGILPEYTHEFYKKFSSKLDNKWSAHDIYINLRENRRQLRNEVFKRLEIEEHENKENEYSDPNLSNQDDTLFTGEEEEPLDFDDSEFLSSFLNNRNEVFDLFINADLWKQMKPVTRIYKGRTYTVLNPGVWGDIVADEFWYQYRMPCAFNFKKATVSFEVNKPFLYIQGKCKCDDKYHNEFHAIADAEPSENTGLWLKVKTKDTRCVAHKVMKRQLRFNKRKVIGQKVLKEGAANCRRNIARQVQNIGDLPAPILYKSEILRKLLQESLDEELGIDRKGGHDVVCIMQKLKHMQPYIGSIGLIAADPFRVHYQLPEQTLVYKEYCRLLRGNATISLDSTASLVRRLKITDNIMSPNIFLFEIVINIFGTTVSVEQP